MTKIYVTKYVLTDGIVERDAEINFAGDMASVKLTGFYPQNFHGKDWYTTKEDAIKRAEEIRTKKIQSLDKQIKKISALVFS